MALSCSAAAAVALYCSQSLIPRSEQMCSQRSTDERRRCTRHSFDCKEMKERQRQLREAEARERWNVGVVVIVVRVVRVGSSGRVAVLSVRGGGVVS